MKSIFLYFQALSKASRTYVCIWIYYMWYAACILFDHADYLIVQEFGKCDVQALSYLQMVSFFLAFYNQMGTIFTLTPLSHRKTIVHCLYIGPRLVLFQ